MDSPGRNTAGTVKGMLTSDQLAEMQQRHEQAVLNKQV